VKQTELPNIVLVVMDTVGAKRCSLYGHHRPTTPGLERLAADGVLYRYCFAPAAWTVPSHVSLFSGLYPGQHGCNTQNFDYPGNFYVLPEILQQAGYRTAAISSNYLVSRSCNFQYGFDEFHEMDLLFNTDRFYNMRRNIKAAADSYKNDVEEIIFIIKSSFKSNYYSYPLAHLLDRVYRQLWGDLINKSSHATERSIRIAKKLIRNWQKRPFFLFINFMEAHQKYNPPKGYNNLLKRRQPGDDISELLYDQEIAYLDHRLLEFYTFLEKQGLKDQTLFIVTSDHGEAFGEHGFWGHIKSLHNEMTHIPLLVKYPASYGLQGEDDRLVQLHDLFATLLEAAGAPVPAPESSWSLLGPGRDFALLENFDPSFAFPKLAQKRPQDPPPVPSTGIIDAQLLKLIQWGDGRRELYDLQGDFGETANLVDHPDYQGKLAQLQARLEELSPPPWKPGPEPPQGPPGDGRLRL
jgi:arylsulfatase A-like enzyme